VTRSTGLEAPGTGAARTAVPRPWWRRPWMIPLALVVAGYLVYQVSPFAGLDERTAPTPPHDGFPAYYPILMVHILCGILAMVTVCLQVWPWLRAHHPAVHRGSGRVYVVAALIGGVTGLVLVRFAPPVGQIGVALATLTWLVTTLTGFVMARRRKYALHRRFMLYSFAVVMNNVWGVIIVYTGMHVSAEIDFNYLIEAARWVGWVGNLMLVQWWLYRTARRPAPKPVRQSTVDS
jgi:uncharacterized membrane protein YozB (DUF420 family)